MCIAWQDFIPREVSKHAFDMPRVGDSGAHSNLELPGIFLRVFDHRLAESRQGGE